MAAILTAPDTWVDRRRRVKELRARQGFARQLLDFYGALLAVQENACLEAASVRPPGRDLASYVAEVVVPSIVDVSLFAGPDQLRSQLLHRLETEQPVRMIEQWIAGESQPVVDRYLARASLGPVLETLDAEARAACGGPRDARHCPECGGPPQLSYFEPSPDDLATGPRRLLCARCGASWGYPRMTCPGCGEDESAKLPVFSEHGTASGERGSIVRGLPAGAAADPLRAVFPHVRIEACESCRQYVLNIDLATDRAAVAVVDEMAAIPLDLYARDRGFTKVIPNLMGF
jgi:FdhE protein